MPTRIKVSTPARIANPASRVRTVFSLMALMLLIHASLPAHARTRAPHASKPVLHKIAALEHKLQAAEMNNNTSVMANMLADDYVGISPDGTLVSKAETLMAYKTGSIHFTAMTTSERKIRVYGNTAVVISKDKVAGTHNGNDLTGTYRYTRVYHLTGANWKVVSFEASQIPDGAKLTDKQDKKL
jgi:ketosteroid isomerase-like protein